MNTLLHNEVFHELHSSPHHCAVDKIEKMRWAGNVARMVRGEACTGWGNLREKDHWGNPGIDGRMMLKWIFRK
jgi:hypothetical protein